MNWLVARFVGDGDHRGDPKVRQRYGTLSGVVGILLNLLLSGGKFLAGVLTGSIAITADAFNNLSDAGSAVVTLVGFRLAGQKPDRDHPFGHGRMEYLAGLIVSFAILLVGIELGKTGIQKIFSPQAVEFSWISVGILVCAILVKLWMAYFNRTMGRRIDSQAMLATATDSLSDVAATSAVLLGTLVSHFFRINIDGWVGLLVAAFILRAGWGAAKSTLDPLLGQAPDPELVNRIQAAVLAHPEIVGIHDVVVHDYGPGRVMASLHAEVPMTANILVAHDIIDQVERALLAQCGVEVVIHMDPIATDDAEINQLRLQVAQLVTEIDSGLTIHDFRMTAGPQHTNLIFDVVVPFGCPLGESQVRQAVERQVATLGEDYFAVVAIDQAFTV